MSIRRWLLAFVLVAGSLVMVGCADEAPPRAVHVLTIDGEIDRVAARYLGRGIERAETEQAAAVVVRIDTPGGAIESMRDAVGQLEPARVPVITWVGPPGAQAASAGTFVVMAGHVAAMAPSTTIGAATPVTATGGDVEGALGRKVANDAAAFARGVAALRGRNAEWAEQAVREAVSASATEAVELGVVDFIAEDLEGLLANAEGRTVQLPGNVTSTIAVASAPVVETRVNAYERLLSIMGSPLVVGLLLLAGIALVWTELSAPGLIVPGATGALLLIGALLGLGTLLPQEAAIAAIALGVLLLALEIVVPGGVVGGLGALAIMVGLAVLAVGSTAIDLRLLMTFGAIVVMAIALAAGAALALLARRYRGDTERSTSELI